ncbi:MAG: F0F1 ATP synthase subunit A [Bacillota bacterium]
MIEFYTNLSPSLKTSLIITLFLIVFLSIIGKKAARLDPRSTPKGIVFIMIMFVDTLNNFIKEFYGKNWRRYTPILMAILLFLALANTSALFGLANPLANINIALGFSIFAFLTIQIAGLIARRPKNRLKDLSSPNAMLLPLNLISEISTPLAMGLRLFGNLISGSIMMVVVFQMLNIVGDMLGNIGPWVSGLGNTVITTAILHPIFNIGFGLIQAFVYFMLLTVFLSMAIEEPIVEEEAA